MPDARLVMHPAVAEAWRASLWQALMDRYGDAAPAYWDRTGQSIHGLHAALGAAVERAKVGDPPALLACMGCAFYLPYSNADGGTCRRNPPTMRWPERAGLWPEVEPTDGCGEFRGRQA